MEYLAPIRTQQNVFSQLEMGRLNQIREQAGPETEKTDQELRALSKQFESIFIHQLLKSMRSTVQKSGLLGSHATDMYESMYDQELANLLSKERGMGLSEMVYKDLVRLNNGGKPVPNDPEPSIPVLSPALKLPGEEE